MRLFELLNEVPLAGYTTLSDKPTSKPGDHKEISKDPEDFNKRSSSYTDKRDRRLLTNPTSVERMHNLFQNTSEDFFFYMVNSKEAREHTEVGFVDDHWLVKNMPTVAAHLENHPDGITVIFTNNKGDQKIPMTPWIMAHRIAHSFSRGSMQGITTEYETASKTVDHMVNDILKDFYGLHRSDMLPKARKKFFEAIGTFRSARKGILRQDFEFLNEVFAQYLITGQITFNNPPKRFALSKAWGNDTDVLIFRGSDEDYRQVQQMLVMLSNDLEYYIENMLSQAIGSTFVM